MLKIFAIKCSAVSKLPHTRSYCPYNGALGGMIPKAAFEHFVKACRGGQPPQACSRAVEYMQQHDLWNSESLELAKIGCEFNEKPACKAGADILNLGLGDIAINKRRARFFEKKLSYIEMASKSS